MKISIYQVDAFASQIFEGNPAAVCPLEKWLEDDLLQKIAMENNLSETAFFVQADNRYELRWFTPTTEVNLCGHATLASAWVIFNELGHSADEIQFHSPRSGSLPVRRKSEQIILNFPSDKPTEIPVSKEMSTCFNRPIVSAHKASEKLLIRFASEVDVKNLSPDFLKVKALDAQGVIATAPGDSVDFVSRFFAPRVGINEDPVTGSAHTVQTPYWSAILRKKELVARQISSRGGQVSCSNLGDRVDLGGEGRLFMKGEIFV